MSLLYLPRYFSTIHVTSRSKKVPTGLRLRLFYQWTLELGALLSLHEYIYAWHLVARSVRLKFTCDAPCRGAEPQYHQKMNELGPHLIGNCLSKCNLL